MLYYLWSNPDTVSVYEGTEQIHTDHVQLVFKLSKYISSSSSSLYEDMTRLENSERETQTVFSAFILNVQYAGCTDLITV